MKVVESETVTVSEAEACEESESRASPEWPRWEEGRGSSSHEGVDSALHLQLGESFRERLSKPRKR
jgi:hypothetical protein